jgi:hypothetical protein
MNGLPCQDTELKAEKCGEKNPLKMLEKLGRKKYASKYCMLAHKERLKNREITYLDHNFVAVIQVK